ncbi:MAG: ABC transporter ATP-binding protein [Rhodospirillaceae bacterium]
MTWLCAHGVAQRLQDDERAFHLEVAALTLGPGSRKAIVGPSGSGKTTAMDLLALASRPYRADSFLLIEADGAAVDLAGMHDGHGDRAAAVRARKFGYALQAGVLLPFLTIGENLLLAQQLAGVDDRAFARELLAEFGVPAPFSTMPSALSVGQRQRVAIARALAHKPSFLFADEPTASLDPEAARRTLGTCLDILMSRDAAALIITHDIDLARDLDFEIVPVTPHSEDGLVSAVIDDCSPPPGMEAQ